MKISLVKCGFLLSMVVGAHAMDQTHVMDVHEVSFRAEETYKNAYMDVDLWVELNGPDGFEAITKHSRCLRYAAPIRPDE